MTLQTLLESSPALTIPLILTTILTFYITSTLYFHPLSHIPGPTYTLFTPLYLYLHTLLGTECTYIQDLHTQYGPIIRISPSEVCLSDGKALKEVNSSSSSSWRKAACYSNFDFEGYETIFSTRDAGYRGRRVKAVMGMFAWGRVRGEGAGVIEGVVGEWVGRLRGLSEGEKGRRVDVLGLCRGLATDSVCEYLFGKRYGVLEEGDGSADVFVKGIVEFGRFFNLPSWVFGWILGLHLKFFASEEEVRAAEKVDEFIVPLVEGSEESGESETYQGRLLNAGISKEETVIQVRDVIFAGTDSTGTNLATLVWSLAKNKEVYARLRKSVHDGDTEYTDAVVKETLRLAMANPTRKPRVVPPGGWTFVSSKDGKGFHLPSGTLAGLQDWTLHRNPDVFPDPYAFAPERWMASQEHGDEMKRDWVPFNTGTRQCIARNFAYTELLIAARVLAEEGVLEEAECVHDKIEVLQWFNSKIKGEKVELIWR